MRWRDARTRLGAWQESIARGRTLHHLGVMLKSQTLSETALASYRLPLVVFLVLVLPLSWYPWLLSLALHHAPSGPNPLGVLVAGLIGASFAGGWRNALGYLRRIVQPGRSVAAVLVTLLLPPLTLLIGSALASLQGVAFTWHAPDWSDLVDRMIFTFLFVGLGEEPGWRGFLLPYLEQRLHPVAATLFVAIIWAVWHIPLMGSEFAWPLVPAFLISLVGAAFVLSWLANVTGGVLLPMLMHAIINTIGAGYVFAMVAPASLARFWWIYALVWFVAGILTIALTAGRLGYATTLPLREGRKIAEQ
jgi:membrane protease YdiL (CAAX protease family)